MKYNNQISWTHDTWNPWAGCTKVSPECSKCYIGREVRKQTDWEKRTGGGLRKPWGEVYLTRTWDKPYVREANIRGTSAGVEAGNSAIYRRGEKAERIFTCSLSDFFHDKIDNRKIGDIKPMHSMYELPAQHRHGSHMVDLSLRADNGEKLVDADLPKDWEDVTWREAAWQVIKETPHMVYLILTKRPERILAHLPDDWGQGYPNVWLGTSVGCRQRLKNINMLRKVPMHPEAVRFISCEPLLEDIAQDINLDGIGWVICGGESGSNPEYLWDANADWRAEMNSAEVGRRTMKINWAWDLYIKCMYAGLPFYFKQITSGRQHVGMDALGEIYRQYPAPPNGMIWMPDKVEVKSPLVVLP